MKNSCFVCPLYFKERDYKYALDMFESKVRNRINAEVYFVFSYEAHEREFKKRFVRRFGYEIDTTILMPESLLKYSCQVTTKKLYGVYYLRDEYDYIATIDCECLFCNSIDVTNVFEEIWDRQTMVVCNKSYLLQHLLKNCVEGLPLHNKEYIQKETENYIYNCWFNEIPVYKMEYASSFFCWLRECDWESILNNYYMVDYYVYLLYLMDRRIINIKKINYSAPLGIMEEVAYTHTKHAAEIEQKIGTHWTSNIESSRNDILMYFHLDHRPTKREIKELIIYSRIKRVIWTVSPEYSFLHRIVKKISHCLLKTNYYRKYEW